MLLQMCDHVVPVSSTYVPRGICASYLTKTCYGIGQLRELCALAGLNSRCLVSVNAHLLLVYRGNCTQCGKYYTRMSPRGVHCGDLSSAVQCAIHRCQCCTDVLFSIYSENFFISCLLSGRGLTITFMAALRSSGLAFQMEDWLGRADVAG